MQNKDEWVGFGGWDAREVAKWIRDTAVKVVADCQVTIETVSTGWLYDLWKFSKCYKGTYSDQFEAARLSLSAAYYAAQNGVRKDLVASLKEAAEILKDVPNP